MPFEKGQSGNPGGRPKEVAEVRELAREHTEEAVRTLAAIMVDTGAPPSARVKAADSLLDRGYGRPVQSVDAVVFSKKEPVHQSDREVLDRYVQARIADAQRTETGAP